jgi:hypothetical protein
MINPTSPHPLQAATISAVSHSGLAAQTLDGRPLRFALVDDQDNVVESGESIADAAWRMSVLAHEQHLIGMGHINVYMSPPGLDTAACTWPQATT